MVCTTMVYRCYANYKASPAECPCSRPDRSAGEASGQRRRLSDNRVLVELIEPGIEATRQKE